MEPKFDQVVARKMDNIISGRKPFQSLEALREEYGRARCELVTQSLRVLHYAIQKNNFGMVKGLLSEDPSLLESSHDGDGKTPLMVAIESQNLMIFGYLLGLGANVDAVDCTGRPLLHLIAQLPDSDVSIQFLYALFEIGAAVFQLWNGDTFLHLIVKNKKKNLFKAALQHGHLQQPIADGMPFSQTKARRLAAMNDSKGKCLIELARKFGKDRHGLNSMEKELGQFLANDLRKAQERADSSIPDVSSPPLTQEAAEAEDEPSSTKRLRTNE